MVELGVSERQRLRGCDLDPDARQPQAAGLGERNGRVDRGDVLGAGCGDQFAGQRARPAADIERAGTRLHACGRDQRPRELAAVAADVPVVGFRRRAERRCSR